MRGYINSKNLKSKRKFPVLRKRMQEIELKRYLKNYKENNSIQ